MRVHLVCLTVVMCAAEANAHAQTIAAVRAGVVASRADSAPVITVDRPSSFSLFPRPRIPGLTLEQQRVLAPIASAVIPGAGQAMLGQDRFLGYLTVEIVAWWRFATNVRERSAQEERYKEVASRVARAQFAISPRDTQWVYYEQMRDYLESGQFSLSASGPIQPETDPTTFNGSRWLLARATNATLADQLSEYERTAVKPEFRWSWRNAQFQFDVFRRYTDKGNDANRAAVRDVLVIGANHVLSMVDAFTTMRLQVRTEADGRTSLGASIRW
jgi:hypothetical protein